MDVELLKALNDLERAVVAMKAAVVEGRSGMLARARNGLDDALARWESLDSKASPPEHRDRGDHPASPKEPPLHLGDPL